MKTKTQNKIQIPRHFKVKLNFSFWPNWTRPDPPFPVSFLTRPYPTRLGPTRRSDQESCNSGLSSVTFVRPAQRVELFDNVFAPSNSSGTWAVGINIVGEKFRRRLKRSCKLNITGCEKLVFFDQYVAIFRKRYKIYGHSYNGRRIGTRMHLSNGAISNGLQ